MPSREQIASQMAKAVMAVAEGVKFWPRNISDAKIGGFKAICAALRAAAAAGLLQKGPARGSSQSYLCLPAATAAKLDAVFLEALEQRANPIPPAPEGKIYVDGKPNPVCGRCVTFTAPRQSPPPRATSPWSRSGEAGGTW